mgnify:CR=1 FL=1
MKGIIPIVIGTDPSSYSMTRSINDAYGEKVIVCCSRILSPFSHTKIADIYMDSYADENYIARPEVLIDLVNRACKENSAGQEKVIFFIPNEIYMEVIYDNLEKFAFEPIIPYPDKQLGEALMKKRYFYARMEEMGVLIPKTRIVSQDNYKDLDLEGRLILKADDNNAYKSSRIKEKEKVYFVDSQEDAIKKVDEIFELEYKNKYQGSWIVQEYIPGGQGTEFTLNGYRSGDDKFSLSQARCLLTDQRPLQIGNYLVLIDSDLEELYALTKKIIRGLDYYGFFNIDMKIHPETGDVYVFEINPRLGRSSYFSNLGGVNHTYAAIEDMARNNSLEQKQTKAFNWIAAGKKECEKHIPAELLKEFRRPDRYANTGLTVDNPNDRGALRNIMIKKYIQHLNKSVFD